MRLVPCFVLAAAIANAAELPVTAVTLSNAGLLEIERRGELAADAGLTFRAPLEAVDDILKTLLVQDPQGTVTGLRLPAQDLAAEAFRGLPLGPDDFASRVALLRALRGQVMEAGGTTGRLADAEEAPAGLRVTLLTETGIRLLQLREGDAVTLQDAGLASRITRAAEALAASKTADEREIAIAIAGATTPREVAIAYVAGAPLWKPSWRLLLPAADGAARLQGWAVVENRSGVDWNGVRLALVSGNPAAYRQPLYAPIEVARPELPVRAAEQVRVTADTGARPQVLPMLDDALRGEALTQRGMRGMARPAPAPAALPPAPAFAAASIAAVPPAFASAEAGRIAYTLPAPVTLRTGETANLPFLDAALPVERLWWVQDLAARNPLNAVRLRNTTPQPLPDGVAAVFATGGYLGDAELRAMGPNETRLLAFARDRDVLLSTAQGETSAPVAVAQQRTGMTLTTVQREETALAIDPRGVPGRLVLDLPRRPGATPAFTIAAEGDFGLRHEAMLDGKPTTLRLVWERRQERVITLWDAVLGNPLLLRWREFDVEPNLGRLPGGPGSVENIAEILRQLPADAPGRAGLERTVALLRDTRVKLDTARASIRQFVVADAALDRARTAAEDRTGAAREAARRALNEASLVAGRAGAAADAAWEAWGRSVDALLQRPEG